MKRMLPILLIGLLLLAGCGTQSPAETTEPGPVAVNSVDEFLAAIAPGAEIVLEAGIYDFSTASDYDTVKTDGYYAWETTSDGSQLVITDVPDLIIRGSGPDGTILTTGPRYANVLTFRGCSNLMLADIASQGRNGEAYGGGLTIADCKTVNFSNLQISGSGTAGFKTENSYDVTISGTEIFDCQFLGVEGRNNEYLVIQNCALHDLGNAEYGGSSVFYFDQCSDTLVSDCTVADNSVTTLIDCYPCDNVTIYKNRFARNKFQKAVFDVDGGLIFEANAMEDNIIPDWFTTERSTVLDSIGKSWDAELLDWYYGPPAETAPEGEQETIMVSTVDEFLAAIGPNREIVLTSDFYDLSAASAYATGYSDYFYWQDEFDGPELVITDVDNLTIRSESGDADKCTISAVPRYADVLAFRRCSNVTLSGFTAGHTVEPGYCTGGVLNFYDSDNLLVENCGLYGCGILGVQAEISGNLTVRGCEIYECSYGGISLGEVDGVVIENNTFRDLGGPSMSFYDCKNVTVDSREVSGNASIE